MLIEISLSVYFFVCDDFYCVSCKDIIFSGGKNLILNFMLRYIF